jgi:membrane protein implicated in regulation of membrane protease activity
MAESSELPARFEPLRPAGRSKRRVALLLGPGAWVVAFIVLAFLVGRRNAVELALLVVAASFVVGLVVSGWMRRGRVREERDA